jgi:hypothetical protein
MDHTCFAFTARKIDLISAPSAFSASVGVAIGHQLAELGSRFREIFFIIKELCERGVN